MMPDLSERDWEMLEETRKWLYLGDDGRFHLREDAPEEIKKHRKKMKKIYKCF